MDFDTFLKVQNEYTTVNEKYSGASEKAVEFSHWVNSQNLTAEQAETVRDCFKYYSQIPAEAARYDSFVSAGLSDDAAYELANSLNALEPEDGKDSVSDLQRYRAVVDAGLSTEEQMNVLGEMMQESEYSKLQTGYSYGVTPEAPDGDAAGCTVAAGKQELEACEKPVQHQRGAESLRCAER